MDGSKGWFESRSRFVQSLYRVLNSWNLPSNFPDLEKVWKIEVKSWTKLIVRSLDFFFWKVTTSASQGKFFSHVGQILFNLACMSLKKLCFRVFLRSLWRRQHAWSSVQQPLAIRQSQVQIPLWWLAGFVLGRPCSNPWPRL